MASRAEIEMARRALNRLSQAAAADLSAYLAGLRTAERVTIRRALAGFYPELLAEYGAAAAALGADMAEGWAADLGLRPQIALAPALHPGEVVGALDRVSKLPDMNGGLRILTDELVKQPYRHTIQDTAHRSGAAWARVPSGSKTCSFCLMTASRGAVYSTSRAAGGDRKYHGDCDCQVVLVRSASDYPAGYDPGALQDVYSTARQNAVANVGPFATTSDILAEVRLITGGH